MTIRTKRRGPRSGELDARSKEKLTTGHDWWVLDGPDRTEAELREIWLNHRDDLLREWIAAKPGTRPWAWWAFDAPREFRRRVAGDGTPVPGCSNYFGQPSLIEGDYSIGSRTEYEPERDYLKRHGLLTKAEL